MQDAMRKYALSRRGDDAYSSREERSAEELQQNETITRRIATVAVDCSADSPRIEPQLSPPPMPVSSKGEITHDGWDRRVCDGGVSVYTAVPAPASCGPVCRRYSAGCKCRDVIFIALLFSRGVCEYDGVRRTLAGSIQSVIVGPRKTEVLPGDIGMLSIGGGALFAMGLAVFSDFVAAYLRILEARMHRQQHDATPEGVSWLKAVFSYACVGYLITDSGRILHRYLSGEVTDFQTIEDLVINYFLITLVGVSLIVASELLMLYQPTRTAGLILQARIVDGRKNWEEHTLRSLVEVTVTFGITVLSYKMSDEVVWSLQAGTFSGVALILSEEYVYSRKSLFSAGAQDEIPADHWIKLAPAVVMMIFFCVQVYSAMMMMPSVPSTMSVAFLWFIVISAIVLTVIALTDFNIVASKFNERAKFLVGKLHPVFLVSVMVFHQLFAFELSLSQFSAGNVVVSAGFGYLTSAVKQELHPEVLLRTGFQHAKNKWMLFPLQTFIEATVFVGVFLGTFTATSTVFSSLTLAALSGIVISFGSHWLCTRLQLTVGNSVRMRLTATCSVVFFLVLFSYISMVAMFWIYHNIDSLEATFCLASLSGVVFLASSELFLLWEPTRKIGQLLQERVTCAKDNWQKEPLRSFLEVFTWFGVVYGSFALYNDLLLALQLGTFSGIAVTLSGEYFRRNRAKLIPWRSELLVEEDEDTVLEKVDEECDPDTKFSDRPRALPVMLLFAYIGSGTFQWIFENMRSLEVTVVLATIAGIVFLCIADLLVMYKPTRWVGIILQDRVIHVKRNWTNYPVRSFVEFGCFLGVIYGTYAIYCDLFVAVQVGTLSGMLVTLIGEQVRSHARARPKSDADVEKSQILPLPVMCMLGLVGTVAFNIIYTHRRNIEVAFVLATTSGVIFALLGDMLVIWNPTRKIGMIIQERILFFKDNFTDHTLRSWTELLSCVFAWYGSYVCFWPGDLLIAIQFGTFTGIMACVCGELAMEYIAEVKHRLIQGVSARLALE
ncbi:hypothetical protein FI667_g12345, partial [Globisporangium splendens]